MRSKTLFIALNRDLYKPDAEARYKESRFLASNLICSFISNFLEYVVA